MPWCSAATWMLTQMKRWGYVKTDADYSALAEQVFLLTDARRQMAALGMAGVSSASGYKPFSDGQLAIRSDRPRTTTWPG